MPKALSDDLRCRILEAYSRGEGSQRELAQRFGVSFEYVRKVRWQLRQNGQMKVSVRPTHPVAELRLVMHLSDERDGYRAAAA
jgi:transposase-like protein